MKTLSERASKCAEPFRGKRSRKARLCDRALDWAIFKYGRTTFDYALSDVTRAWLAGWKAAKREKERERK